MAENGGIWKTFAEYDRRYVYLVLFLVVVVPLLNPLGFPISVSPDTRQFYEVLNTVEEGDIVMVAYNTEFSGFNELKPGIIASTRVLIEKGAKIVIASAHPEAISINPIVFEYLATEVQENDYTYGEDYIDLGYVLVNEAAVAAMAQDFHGVITQDISNNPIAGTFLDDVNTHEDFDLIVDFTTGLSTTYILNHYALSGTPLLVNCIGVMIPSQKNYVDTGLVLGLLGSMRGGAELEYLTDSPGPGLIAMDAFTFGHYMLIGFIIMGNLGYYMYTRHQPGRR
jgi:hypothetical protein